MSAEFADVAPAAEIPPGGRTVVRLGRDYVVVFNVGGRYYAVEDRCSHEDEYLSDGFLHGDTIECRQHGAIFDLATGRELAPPAISPIKTYVVRVENGMVQVQKKR